MSLCKVVECCAPCVIHHDTCFSHSICVTVCKDPPSATYNPVMCIICCDPLIRAMRMHSTGSPNEADSDMMFLTEISRRISRIKG